MALFLAWMSAVTFSADLQATTLLPGEGVHAEQAADEARAVSGKPVADKGSDKGSVPNGDP